MPPPGHAVNRGMVRQKKTGRPVRFEISEQTRETVDNYIKATGKGPKFPGGGPPWKKGDSEHPGKGTPPGWQKKP